MKKYWFFLILLMLGLGIDISAASSGVEDMQGLALKHIKIPFYNDQHLQLLVFSDTGERNGRLMQSGKTLLDVLAQNIDVDKIPDGWQTRLYPLDSSLDKVLDFWKNRYRISDAVVATDLCAIDQANSEASGTNPVSLRAPVSDLDGVGFRADFKNQVIEITSDVKIVLRSSEADPRAILSGSAKVPKDYRVITAVSDSLRLDRKNNEFMLIGNVKVVDGRNTLNCNRLTVYLSDANDDEKQERNIVPGDEKASLRGVRRVLADGDVLLVQRPEDPAKIASELQTSRSDHLEYDVKRGIIVLTGDEKNPELSRGTDTKLSGKRIELLRHEDKMFVMRECQVRSIVRDARGMIAYIRSIVSERANFDGKSNVANFHGNVVASDQKNTLSCDSLRAHLVMDKASSSHKLNLLFCRGNVKIATDSDKVANGSDKKRVALSTVSSRMAELNYLKNKLVFYRDVKVRGTTASLDCDRLDFFLADSKKDKRKSSVVSGAPLAAGKDGLDKTITKMIAAGKVEMISGKDKLNTDILTLLFRELPEGVKPSAGMVQSGGVQLIKIFCDGSVKAISASDKKGKTSVRTLQADNAMSDLLADYSEFHGKVSFSDGQTKIDCRDMYIFTAAAPVDVGSDGKKSTSAVEVAVKSEEEELDADPFEMDMGENSVPTRIAVSEGQDLKRIVCKKEVEISRTGKDNKLQRAGGDQAVYTVTTREVVLSAERPKRPWLSSEGRKQYCDLIRCDMATEDLRGIGNVVVMPE